MPRSLPAAAVALARAPDAEGPAASGKVVGRLSPMLTALHGSWAPGHRWRWCRWFIVARSQLWDCKWHQRLSCVGACCVGPTAWEPARSETRGKLYSTQD